MPVPSAIELTLISNNGKDVKELSYEDLQKELAKINGLAIKPQDILVISAIIILSVLYIIWDLYRYINIYKEKRDRLCTWQTH